MTKQDVIAHFDDIIADQRITWEAVSDFVAFSKDPLALFQDRFYVLHGSGTSGEIGLFFYSKKGFLRGMAHGMGLVTYHLGKRRKRIAFLGSAGGHNAKTAAPSLPSSWWPPASD